MIEVHVQVLILLKTKAKKVVAVSQYIKHMKGKRNEVTSYSNKQAQD